MSMEYTFLIFKNVYILFLLPCLHCQVCGELRLLNPKQINRGDDVKMELLRTSTYKRKDKSLVRWWKYLQNKPNPINTTLQRFHIDVQQARVTLTIRNVTAEDNGGYTVDLGIVCLPPKLIYVTVKEKPSKPTIPILRPTSPSTGKDNSSTMLIGIICGCLAVLIIALLAFGCVIASKRRKKTPTREGSNNVHIQERQPSFQPQGPVYDNHAGSNHGDAPSEAIAEPVEYACVVKKAKRQATKSQTEKGALIYADLDLLAEGSTRGKPTLNLDVGTTYVSIDLALTEQMKRSVLDD